MNQLLITPLTTEKAYTLSSKSMYIFKVPTDASKIVIKKAVEEQFRVTVISIRTSYLKGKTIRFTSRRRSQPKITSKKDTKKAYVTLLKGDSIKIFDEPKANKKDKK